MTSVLRIDPRRISFLSVAVFSRFCECCHEPMWPLWVSIVLLARHAGAAAGGWTDMRRPSVVWCLIDRSTSTTTHCRRLGARRSFRSSLVRARRPPVLDHACKPRATSHRLLSIWLVDRSGPDNFQLETGRTDVATQLTWSATPWRIS